MNTAEIMRWEAVQARDVQADGRFVYSVASTGVYCRPSCGARPALRRNVRFHDTCAAAEAEGFRACKRCRPNEPPLAERHAQIIARVCRLIEENTDALPDSLSLAAQADMSRFHFLRVFREVTGVTPRRYAEKHRAERVRIELRAGNSVTEAIYDSGFNSSSRFYEKSTEILGMTPGQFREGGAGTAIRYAIAQSSLGQVIIGATDRGICAVRFGENEAELTRELKIHFPQAEIAAAGPDFEASVRAVIAHIDSPKTAASLPLDIRGTAFQLRVWQALREIPLGQTVSYSELAARAGNPAAVRAAGSACGANGIGVLIPCHRAIRSDGSLNAYRWGLERKRALLEKEKSSADPAS